MSQSNIPSVFEDPWPAPRKIKPLPKAAIEHVQIAGFFLKVLDHLPKDVYGLVTDEALAYSEWRYVVYIRFLHWAGLAPYDQPPPWDVAMVWYCHLLSTTQFHHHLFDHGHKSMGLEYSHFPLAELVELVNTAEWTHPKIKKAKAWKQFNESQSGQNQPLTYQLWDKCPWTSESDLSTSRRLLHKLASSKPSPIIEPGPTTQIFQPTGDPQQCALQSETGQLGTWSLEDYTLFRSGRGGPKCRAKSDHVDKSQKCELAPWATIHVLKAVLYSQAAFWKALLQMMTPQSDLTGRLGSACADYVTFMTGIQKYEKEEMEDATQDVLRLFPPSIEVDLLLHTHRLFPGCYWRWCRAELQHLVDYAAVRSTEAIISMLYTPEIHWESLPRTAHPKVKSPDEGLKEFAADAAIPLPLYANLEAAITGENPAGEAWRPPRGSGAFSSAYSRLYMSEQGAANPSYAGFSGGGVVGGWEVGGALFGDGGASSSDKKGRGGQL